MEGAWGVINTVRPGNGGPQLILKMSGMTGWPQTLKSDEKVWMVCTKIGWTGHGGRSPFSLE